MLKVSSYQGTQENSPSRIKGNVGRTEHCFKSKDIERPVSRGFADIKERSKRMCEQVPSPMTNFKQPL
jgi:hypothetical protein